MADSLGSPNLHRLLTPRQVAVFGGRHAAEVIRQCRRMGFEGDLWPVHPDHETIEGLRCYRRVEDLPAAPDASFLAVPREATVAVAAQLADRGAGGAVCYASGFAEAGGDGIGLQRALIAAAGPLALIGPNCYGVLNYLDGAALWPDQHGGRRVERGVAIVTQSGNIGLNVTMQRRCLPLAYLISVGNCAGSSLPQIVECLLDDPRVTAIGLHVEGLDDVAGFARVAVRARATGVPIVVLKSGSSELGARVGLSHTSSLAGPDELYDALFARYGVARVRDVAGFVETLKLLSVHGRLPGWSVASASCSGGEAALLADLAAPLGIALPALPASVASRLSDVLGGRVAVGNPLDYHTYIWGDLAAQTECFAALLSSGCDLHLLVLDLPREDRCARGEWHTTLDAWIAAHRRMPAPACVVSSLPEGLPEAVGERLLAEGIAPMQGLGDCLSAIRAAARAGRPSAFPAELAGPHRAGGGPVLDEWEGKQELARAGVAVPVGGIVGSADDAAALAASLGYPVVVKAVGAELTHKTEAGAVRLNLADADAVRAAVGAVRGLSSRFLVERMVTDAVAELIVGLRQDAQFGPVLTIGMGGVLVELLRDTATLLLPASQDEILAALRSLRGWPLLSSYRGRPPGDVTAVLSAVEAIAGLADRVLELDVNPLLVLPSGAVAVDALVRLVA